MERNRYLSEATVACRIKLPQGPVMSQPALQAVQYPEDDSTGATEARAKALVNPTSGLANDYLNIFNELVMLVAQLPDIPEFADDILAWRPRSYLEYFAASSLPGSHTAVDAYAGLDARFRKEFEDAVAELDRIATGCVAGLRRLLKKGDGGREALIAQCDRTSSAMREVMLRASNLVDHGSSQVEENAQRRADRLLAVRIQAIRDVEDFHGRPRF